MIKKSKCEFCIGSGCAVLGFGSYTDFFPCPACIGATRNSLWGIYLDHALELSEEYNRPIKWIDNPLWDREFSISCNRDLIEVERNLGFGDDSDPFKKSR